MAVQINLKRFILIALIVSIWVLASEQFRWVLFVLPEIKGTLNMVPGIAPQTPSILLLWMVWNTILTCSTVFIYFLFAAAVATPNFKIVLLSSTFSWLFFFVLFWLGVTNMGLFNQKIMLITLPLSWLELLVATIITAALNRRMTKK